jgi:hypothetical protein
VAIEQIKTSIFTKLESLAGLPDIFYPNVGKPLPSTDYIRPDVLPAATDAVGLASTDQENGIFQVSIFIVKGSGELVAPRVAQLLLDGFPRNLALTGVRFNKTGSVEPPVYEGKWQITPVSFTYINIA